MEISTARLTLSIIIVGAFVLTTLIFALAPIFAGTPLSEIIENFKLFSSAYSGIVGMIVGFYFGKS